MSDPRFADPGNYTVHEETVTDGKQKVTVRTRVLREGQSRSPGHWAYFHLQPDAPEWALDVMYRELSKRCHPDVTNDQGELQRILNETYQLLKASFRS